MLRSEAEGTTRSQSGGLASMVLPRMGCWDTRNGNSATSNDKLLILSS
jgi:hypothetical protein